MAPKQTDPQFKLRLTPEIKAEIELSAAANGRSMNAEILHRLQQTIDAEKFPIAPDVPGDQRMSEVYRITKEELEEITAMALKMVIEDNNLNAKLDTARKGRSGGFSAPQPPLHGPKD